MPARPSSAFVARIRQVPVYGISKKAKEDMQIRQRTVHIIRKICTKQSVVRRLRHCTGASGTEPAETNRVP